MRLHISLDDATVAELDRRVGRRGRSAFIAQSLRRALDDERRWEDVEAALGAIPGDGHPWDEDPAAWVREQRRADARRTG
jgi:Arc/MetJ family transcription regulator